MKNQNIHQNTFDKLEGVHFGIDEKKLDNKLFLNDSKKFITWNIQYNPYIFIGLIKDEITFDNLQVKIRKF